MFPRTLPKELISLVHFVELNDAGWRQRAMNQLVIYCLSSCSEPRTAEEIHDAIGAEFDIQLSLEEVELGIALLVKHEKLIEVRSQYKISETVRTQVIDYAQEEAELEKRVRERFIRVVQPKLEPMGMVVDWETFNSEFLMPLIHESGAKTYELISGSEDTLQHMVSYREFIREFHGEQKSILVDAIDEFFDTNNDDLRTYILRNLHAFLLLLSTNLTEGSLNALYGRLNENIALKIFVDTNFLFSILDLHDNPSNEAAAALQDLARTLSQRINIQLYVLPITVDEAKRTLESYENKLAEIQPTTKLSEAVNMSGVEISGITKRFLQAAGKSTHRLSVHEYFEPYITDMLTVLRQHNVGLYNENLARLSRQQDVIDDIADLETYEHNKRGSRAKNYDAIKHDVLMWHFARGRRSTLLESTLQAEFWIVTIDYRFLGFDAYKRRHVNDGIPVCVHPAALVQMLQFWIPRTPQSEAALINSLRSMLPREFDVDAERVTIRILKTLSRYENLDDLSEQSVASILVNQALRQKLTTDVSTDEQIEFVRDAIIEETEQLRKQLQIELQEKALLNDQLNEVLINQSDLKQQVMALSELEQSGGKRIAELSSQLTDAETEKSQLENRLATMESSLAALRLERSIALTEARILVTRRKFAALALTTVAIALAAVYFVSPLLGDVLGLDSLLVMVVLSLVCLMGWSFAVERIGIRSPSLKDWKVISLFAGYRKLVFSVIATLVLSIIANFLYDLLTEIR